MPPSKRSSPSKAPRTDIRGFFGAPRSAPTTKPRASASSRPPAVFTAHAIEISDDEPEASSRPKQPSRASGGDGRGSTSTRKSTAAPPQASPPPTTLKRKKAAVILSSSEDEDEPEVAPPRKKTALGSTRPINSPNKNRSTGKSAPKKSASKKKADADFVPSSDDDGPPPKAKAATLQKAPTKSHPPNGAKRDDGEGAADAKAKPKAQWVAAMAARNAGPAAPGSKSIPDNADPNSLSGLSFVFTGEFSAFSRDEIVDIAKRFGGRVVTQPSSRTSFVVVGADAGPSKLAAIKKNNLKTLDEDQFLNLVGTRVPDAGDEKLQKKLAKEQEAIRQAAKEMEKREKQGTKSSQPTDLSGQLWTDRYAPRNLKEICGNKGQIEKLQLWLHDWPGSVKANFKKPGKNGMNTSRAVFISGPPGIGKTTAAHLCAMMEGFTPIELNASDARSKKIVESSANISNTSLDGWMAGGSTTNVAGVTITDKTCLIMDEVDGMSAGDRGGVGALLALIKKTKIPIICIANDKGAQKLKSLFSTAFNLPFRRPEASAVRSRILSIIYKEKMKVPANVIDQLVAGAQSDIRQVLNMLSTWRLSNNTMDYDEGKDLVKMNEKNTIMSPFDITNRLLGPYLFSATARETLNDKIELYFHDHSFMPLFIQENYLKTQPSRVKNDQGAEKILSHLKLMDKAASSISDGDLVDALIHGSEQHWSLMPLHAVCSTVRPSSFLYGMGSGYGGPNAMSFPSWLGQNSKQNKLNRQLVDIHARMRLKISGDRMDIRQSYIPALLPHVVGPLMNQGVSAVDEVIERMDDYFLNREDWDAVVELGLDQWKDEAVLKKISSATKSAFTRKYNSQSHPIAFHKAQELGKAPQKLAGGPAPDLEEAYDVDNESDAAPEETKDADDDLSKDNLIKAPKRGAANKTKKGKSNGPPAKGKTRS